MPAPLFASDTTARRGHADFARFHFLDPVAADFSVDWEAGARVTVALLRAEAGRHPADPDLRELVGEHFPAEQWIHLRTTNPIESTFSTVKHRTKVTRGTGSPASALAMVFTSNPPRPAGARSPAPTSSPWSAPAPASRTVTSSNGPRPLPHDTGLLNE